MFNIRKVKFEIFDNKTGKLVFKKEQLMKSFLKNWIYFAHTMGAGLITDVAIDTASANVTLGYTNQWNWIGPLADVNYGIVVGTGNTAVAITDVSLVTKILEGITIGKLSHALGTMGNVTVSGSTAYFLLARSFNNAYAGSITIEEVGLIIRNVTQGKYLLIARDLTGGIAVAENQTFVGTYTIGTTV